MTSWNNDGVTIGVAESIKQFRASRSKPNNKRGRLNVWEISRRRSRKFFQSAGQTKRRSSTSKGVSIDRYLRKMIHSSAGENPLGFVAKFIGLDSRQRRLLQPGSRPRKFEHAKKRRLRETNVWPRCFELFTFHDICSVARRVKRAREICGKDSRRRIQSCTSPGMVLCFPVLPKCAHLYKYLLFLVSRFWYALNSLHVGRCFYRWIINVVT